MYQDSKRTCTAIVLLIKPYVWWRTRCRRRRGFVNSLIYPVSGCLFCFFFRSLFYLAEVIFSSKSRKESLELMFPFKV